jgi:hypothetical protein
MEQNNAMTNQRIAIEWKNEQPRGTIEVSHGQLGNSRIVKGKGKLTRTGFAFAARGNNRIELAIADARLDVGAHATRVMVKTARNGFSFFLRDVTSETPMLIPLYGVMVVPAEDRRSYAEVEAAVLDRGGQSLGQQFESEPEESYEQACARNRNEICPTWLGLGRDMRFFGSQPLT